MHRDLAQLERSCRLMRTPLGAGQLVCRQWGQGPAVVLLHGGNGSWRHWVHTIPFLSRFRTVFVPDIPGLGDSDEMPGEHTPSRIAAVLGECVEQFVGREQHYDLVGFSYGAILAGHLAGIPGTRVGSLVLVGAPCLGPARPHIALEKWRALTSREEARSMHRLNLSRLMIADAGRIDELAVDIQETNAVLARLKSRRHLAADSLLQAMRHARCQRLTAMYGGMDAIVGNRLGERVDALRLYQPQAQVFVVPGAGHWVAYEAADSFNRLLGLCLDGLLTDEEPESVLGSDYINETGVPN